MAPLMHGAKHSLKRQNKKEPLKDEGALLNGATVNGRVSVIFRRDARLPKPNPSCCGGSRRKLPQDRFVFDSVFVY